MDTPLHNAARWNHPALVNELLLYGASYTATNNEGKTPRNLTSDDLVHNLFWKANNGIIAVGSYCPLARPADTPTQRGSEALLMEGAASGGGVTEGGVARQQDDVRLDGSCDGATESHDLIKEEAERRESHDIREREGSHDALFERSESYDDQSEKAGSHDDLFEREGSHDLFDGEDHDFVVIDDEEVEHRSIGNQQSQGQSAEEVIEELVSEQKPHPKRNEQLFSLLKAIEEFDR